MMRNVVQSPLAIYANYIAYNFTPFFPIYTKEKVRTNVFLWLHISHTATSRHDYKQGAVTSF